MYFYVYHREGVEKPYLVANEKLLMKLKFLMEDSAVMNFSSLPRVMPTMDTETGMYGYPVEDGTKGVYLVPQRVIASEKDLERAHNMIRTDLWNIGLELEQTDADEIPKDDLEKFAQGMLSVPFGEGVSTTVGLSQKRMKSLQQISRDYLLSNPDINAVVMDVEGQEWINPLDLPTVSEEEMKLPQSAQPTTRDLVSKLHDIPLELVMRSDIEDFNKALASAFKGELPEGYVRLCPMKGDKFEGDTLLELESQTGAILRLTRDSLSKNTISVTRKKKEFDHEYSLEQDGIKVDTLGDKGAAELGLSGYEGLVVIEVDPKFPEDTTAEKSPIRISVTPEEFKNVVENLKEHFGVDDLNEINTVSKRSSLDKSDKF